MKTPACIHLLKRLAANGALCGSLAASAAVWAADVTVRLDAPPVSPGQSATASLILEGGAEIAGIDLVLSGPEFVSLGAPEPGSAAAGKFLMAARVDGSQLHIAMAGSEPLAQSSTTLLRFPIKVAPTAPVGAFELSVTRFQCYDAEPKLIPAQGSVTPLSVAPPAADLDGNGLPDEWERRYFGADTGARDRDFDHDGLTDFDEFVAGTDPAMAASGLRIVGLHVASGVDGAASVLQWLGEEGKSYRIQWSNGPIQDHSAWRDVYRPQIQKAGATFSWMDDGTRTYEAGSRERYYRVVAVE